MKAGVKSMEMEQLFKKSERKVYIVNGKHLLIHGSSMDSYYDTLLSNIKISAVVTDPPYGINLLSNKNTLGRSKTVYKPVHGDTSTEAFKMFYEKRIVSMGINNYAIFGGNYFAPILPSAKGWIAWDKKVNAGMSFSRTELIYTSFHKKTDIIEYRYAGAAVEREEREYGYKRFHPTQKPIGLLRRVIQLLPDTEEYILDGFGGSASLMCAAEYEGTKSIIFEVDEEYINQGISLYLSLFPSHEIKEIVF